MSEIDWLQMLEYRQSLHRLSRTLLSRGKDATLTASELELLSLLYLEPAQNTPLALSARSATKKEAVSRSIRQLTEKGLLEKQPNPLDDRSYTLSLTEEGSRKLRENYGAILGPMYALRRAMGDDFVTLFHLLQRADGLMQHNAPAAERNSEV